MRLFDHGVWFERHGTYQFRAFPFYIGVMSNIITTFITKVGSKTLTISDDEIVFEGKLMRNFISAPVEIKYFTKLKEFYHFGIGQNYCISLRDRTENRLDISVGYYLGIRRGVKYRQYSQVLDEIWTRFFDPAILGLMEQLDGGDRLKIGKLEIDRFSISELKGKHRVKVQISIEDLEISKYWDQVVLSSYSDPKKFISLKYEWDWNISVAEILIDYLRQTLN